MMEFLDLDFYMMVFYLFKVLAASLVITIILAVILVIINIGYKVLSER